MFGKKKNKKRAELPPYIIDITAPKSWHALSQQQLRYVYRLLAHQIPVERVQLYLFLQIAGWRVVSLDKENNMAVLKTHHGIKFKAHTAVLTAAADEFSFLAEPPKYPVRIEKWKKYAAVDAQLHGVIFGHYLQLENLFQGFLQTQQPEALHKAVPLLYPGAKEYTSQELIYNIASWLTSLKLCFSEAFPELFRPTPQAEGEEPTFPDMREIMLAELRALTGGDVTKQNAVLESDTWDALDELNAKAREARELDAIYKK